LAAVASCKPSAVAALPSVPTTTWLDDVARACVVLEQRPSSGDTAEATRYYLGPSQLDGSDIDSAKVAFVPSQGWTVRIEFTRGGSAVWDDLAQRQFHQQVALVLEGVVVSAPTIQPGDPTFSSFEGTAVISGDFTERQTKDLAAVANGGGAP